MDNDGNLMQDRGGGMAMDWDSGELHIMDSSIAFGIKDIKMF